jgi:hypothetical protein
VAATETCVLADGAMGADRAVSAAQATPALIRIFTAETFVDQIVALETREGVSGFKLTGVQGPRRCPGTALGSYAPIRTGVPISVIE